jgi:hypothetical protein
VRLTDALNQIYVLLPVLDDAKHYRVAPDEVDKLIHAGAGWLASHPDRGLIARRYLAHRRSLASAALTLLDDSADDEPTDPVEPAVRNPPLAEQRRRAVLDALAASGAQRVWIWAAVAALCSPTWCGSGATPRSSGATCPRAAWNWPRGGCGWTGCRPASGTGSSCGRPR